MSKRKFIIGQECFDALAAGKTLVENQGNNKVYLDSNGKQVVTNPNRTKPYKFDNENTWYVLEDKKLQTIKIKPENKFIRILKDIFWVK